MKNKEQLEELLKRISYIANNYIRFQKVPYQREFFYTEETQDDSVVITISYKQELDKTFNEHLIIKKSFTMFKVNPNHCYGMILNDFIAFSLLGKTTIDAFKDDNGKLFNVYSISYLLQNGLPDGENKPV